MFTHTCLPPLGDKLGVGSQHEFYLLLSFEGPLVGVLEPGRYGRHGHPVPMFTPACPCSRAARASRWYTLALGRLRVHPF